MKMPEIEPGTFLVIRTDGHEEIHRESTKMMTAIHRALGIDTADVIILTWQFGRVPDLVMIVDDVGYKFDVIERRPGHIVHRPTVARKPVNAKATELYLSVCMPGTTHKIVGDVAICHDSDHGEKPW